MSKLTSNSVFFSSDSQPPLQEESTNGSNGCLSPNRKQQGPSSIVPRPLSPDSPEIISELQRYTGGAGVGGSGVQTESNMPSPKVVQTNSSGSSFTSGNVSHRDASVTNVIQPNMDANAAQDLRTSSKRKASTPTLEERPSKQPSAGRHNSTSLASQGFPFSGGYGLPPLGISPAMLGGSLGLFMGAGSPYFQSPHTHMGDSSYVYPDLFGFGGTSAVPTSSSSMTATTTAVSPSSTSPSSSCASVKAVSSAPGAMPPFMLSPSMASMAAMLPPGFPFSYSQSLASLYTGSLLPGGLPGPAASPSLAGASYHSQYPPTSAPSSRSSSPSSFSLSARSDGHRGPVLINGGNIGSSSDDDGDVIEVSGE